MLQSKWVRIPVKIILVWLVITVYFYFQHPVVYRYLDIDANIPIGDGQLLIHEIQVSNLDREQQYSWMRDDEMPWRIKILYKLHERGLPLSWQNPINSVLMFYSWPPLADDRWTYSISGTFISPDDIDTEKSTLDGLSLYIYPSFGGGGMGRQWESSTPNAAMINAKGKIASQKIDKPLIINVIDRENDRTTRLVLNPRWQKERLIYGVSRINPYKNPAAPVKSFMYEVYNGKPQQALDHVLTERRTKISLPAPSEQLKGQDIEIVYRLSWTDVYEDYLNVYQVKAEVGKASENSFIPVQKLTFYTIMDQDGSYKIIDWRSAD